VSARSFERLMSGDLQMRSTPPAGDDRASLDVFIGGGGDDLMPGGGVLRDYARRHAAETGRRVAYFADAGVGRSSRSGARVGRSDSRRRIRARDLNPTATSCIYFATHDAG
jgi:hypothetical protein